MRVSGPVFGLVVALCTAAVGAGPARAAASDNGPWLNALSAAFVVIDLTTGDLDGDGKDETVACYREDVERTVQKSGIAIFSGKGASSRPVFHVQLDRVLCEKVRISGRQLGILLAGDKRLVWTYGKEIQFGQVDMVASASSSKDGSHGPDKAIDGDLRTSWAEGAEGTGLGQTITLKLKKPTDIGAIGIFGGNGSSERAYFDDNRIHRGSFEMKTEADVGDAAAGIDFSSLGIESLGDRQEFTVDNKPAVTYIRVGRKDVVQVQLRVDSVYLGDKKDDTHVAEIEIVPLLSLSETVDRATDVAQKPKVDGHDGAPQKPRVNKGDDAVKKLDASGSPLIGDDGL